MMMNDNYAHQIAVTALQIAAAHHGSGGVEGAAQQRLSRRRAVLRWLVVWGGDGKEGVEPEISLLFGSQ